MCGKQECEDAGMHTHEVVVMRLFLHIVRSRFAVRVAGEEGEESVESGRAHGSS